MIIGSDISHWEDSPLTPQEINFNVMKAAGAKFCIFKATQALFTDRVFQISWSDCKGILPRGAYCYLDWTKTGLEQAKYFVDTVYGKGDDPELPPIADFESRINIPSGGVSGHLWNFVDYVEKQTGKIPIIYTSPDYWKNFGSPHIAWKKYPLWIANYYVVKPSIPLPWTDFLFWQYTDRGDGLKYGCEAKEVDLNWFNGTEQDLSVLCGNGTPPALTIEQKVEALYEQGKQHGWTLP